MKLRHSIALAASAFATVGVVVPAHADEPTRPAQYRPTDYPPSGARLNMLLAGAGTTAGWYGAALGFSYLFPDAPGADDLRIPVAGPWMALADTGCADTDPGCSAFTVVLRAILTTMDGVGQAGGVIVMGEALFLPTSAPAPREKKKLPPLRLERRETGLDVRPVPFVAGRDGWGLGVVGSF